MRKWISVFAMIFLCLTFSQGVHASAMQDVSEYDVCDDEIAYAEDTMGAESVPVLGENSAEEPLVGASEQSYMFTVAYRQTEARNMLSEINGFRTGSNAWYWNEDNETKTECTGLSELSYDYELEKVAMQRAAELVVSFSHTRPNGTDCYTAYAEQGYTYSAAAENIAAGYGNAHAVFIGWREEDKDYSGQGHRRNMLDSDLNRIGIACVSYGGTRYWVQEFAYSDEPTTETAANDAETTVPVSVASDMIEGISLNPTPTSVSVREKESVSLPIVNFILRVKDHWKNGPVARPDVEYTWSVHNTSMAYISGSGLTGKAAGRTSITTTVYGREIAVTVTVNHVPVTDPAVPATCTEEGLTEGRHCSACGIILTPQQKVEKKAHTEVPDPAVPASCTEEGLTEGSHCSVCGTVLTEQQKVEKKAHTEVTDPAVPASCTEEGLTEGSHCSVCGTVLTEQQKVEKKAHTEVTDPAVPATCTKQGLTEGSHCSVCKTVIKAQQTVKALGHNWGEWTVTKEATYESAGLKRRVCTRDSSHVETQEIPKLTKIGFSDVQDPKNPYYKAIYWAADTGITKGYSDGTFGINKPCTRGEMIMFLWRYVGKPAPKNVSKSPFRDVAKTHAFYKAILWASQKGIAKGYSDGTFGINRNVSRGECMMFLWRLKGKPAPKAVSVSPFRDVPKSHVFYNAILWGYQKKITTGYTSGDKKGTFGINENCTRGQIVTFLYRAK